MNLIESIVLGFIQGLTEFLPVSSSGHLALFQKLFHLNGNNLVFDLILHTGTLLALIIFFFKDLLLMADIRKKENLFLFFYIIVATIFTGAIGFVISKYYENLTSLYLLAFFFFMTACLLLFTKNLKPKNEELNTKKSIFIGIMQGIAALPGVSRSGSTIVAGLFAGLSREKAFLYSFVLSIPAILGADLLEVLPVLRGQANLGNISLTTLFAGFITALVIGYFSLQLLRKIVISNKFYYFGYYCLFIALLTLVIGL